MSVGAEPLGEIRAKFVSERVDPYVCHRSDGIPHPPGMNLTLSGERVDVESIPHDCAGEGEQRRVEPLLVSDARLGERGLKLAVDAQLIAGDLEATVGSVDPPAAPRVLLEPARREVVDERVMGVPRQDLVQASDVAGAWARRCRGDCERPRHLGPERRGSGVFARRALARCTLAYRRGQQRRRDAKARRSSRRGDDDQERLAT